MAFSFARMVARGKASRLKPVFEEAANTSLEQARDARAWRGKVGAAWQHYTTILSEAPKGIARCNGE